MNYNYVQLATHAKSTENEPISCKKKLTVRDHFYENLG